MDADILVRGLTSGSIYALVAVSFNILYRPTNVFNFAQGELVMLGAMLFATATTMAGMPAMLAFALTLAGVGLLALLQERIAVAPILARSSSGTGWIITTLATSIIISNLAARFWAADPILVKPPAMLSGDLLSWGGIEVQPYQLALMALTIVLVGIVETAYRTLQGKAIQAMAEDRDGALLRGVDPDRLSRWSFFIGGAFAGLTGILAGPVLYASTSLGAGLLLKGFAAAAVGSIGNNKGALLAGYLIGITEAAGAAFLSPGYQEAVIFVVVLALLLLRPQGLFGRSVTRSV